jgi:methionine synthase I (cobalamin-dependent)
MARYQHNLFQLSGELFITDGGLEVREVRDDGNPEEFGGQHRALRDKLNHLNVLGGCCGTDHRHLEAICKAALN